MRIVSIVLILSTLIAAVAPLMAGDQISDDRIYDDVRRRLANHPDVKGGGLQVDVKQGEVTLRGKLKQPKQKLKAEQVARKVKGVKKVVNLIEVELP